MTKKKVKVEIIICPVCAVKYKKHCNGNKGRHEKSRYHKVVKFYKKAMKTRIKESIKQEKILIYGRKIS